MHPLPAPFRSVWRNLFFSNRIVLPVCMLLTLISINMRAQSRDTLVGRPPVVRKKTDSKQKATIGKKRDQKKKQTDQDHTDQVGENEKKAGSSQDSPWLFSGNMSLGFDPFFINAAPLVGYRFTPHLIGGGGPTYIYHREGLSSPTSSVGSKGEPMHVYGGRIFVARRLYKQLFVQAETEALNYPYLTVGEQKQRDWVVNPLAGLSYNLSLGGKSFFGITVLYNFNYYNNRFNQQLYNSPLIFRLGAGIGNSQK